MNGGNHQSVESVMVSRDTVPITVHPEQLWIGGEGPLSRLVMQLSAKVGFAVTVFDSPSVASELQAGPAASRTLGIVLAADIDEQIAFLTKWLHQPFVFLALAASRDRRNQVFSKLIESQVATRVILERLVFSVGPGVSTLSTDELAICIAAQLIQNRFERRISFEAASRIRSPSLIT